MLTYPQTCYYIFQTNRITGYVGTTIRVRKRISIHASDSFQVLLIVPVISLMTKGCSEESFIAFNFHASLVLSVWTSSSSFFAFHNFDIFKHHSYFVEGPSICVWYFPGKIQVRITGRNGVTFSLHLTRWPIVLIHPITDDVHFDHWVCVVSAELLCFKVTLVSPL